MVELALDPGWLRSVGGLIGAGVGLGLVALGSELPHEDVALNSGESRALLYQRWLKPRR
jgi:hypothetical protein